MYLSFAWIVVSSASMAATITVDLTGGGDYTAIQPAIDAAQHGDMVLVKPGEYVITEPITFLGKLITLKGENGPRETTIRMSDEPADPRRASVVIFENQETDRARLEGFTITGGSGTLGVRPWQVQLGGGVLSGASPRLRNCAITGNDLGLDGEGAAVYSDSSELTLENCTISGT